MRKIKFLGIGLITLDMLLFTNPFYQPTSTESLNMAKLALKQFGICGIYLLLSTYGKDTSFDNGEYCQWSYHSNHSQSAVGSKTRLSDLGLGRESINSAKSSHSHASVSRRRSSLVPATFN